MDLPLNTPRASSRLPRSVVLVFTNVHCFDRRMSFSNSSIAASTVCLVEKENTQSNTVCVLSDRYSPTPASFDLSRSVLPNPRAAFRISSLVVCLIRVKVPNCCLIRSPAYSNGLGVGVGVATGGFLVPVKLQSLQANSITAMIARLEIDFIILTMIWANYEPPKLILNPLPLPDCDGKNGFSKPASAARLRV